MTRWPPRKPQRPGRVPEPADVPENYEETIVSLTSDPICPECAQGKHLNCVGEALDEHDEFVPCYCPTCGAGDA